MDISENSGVFPPNHPLKNRVFHYFHHPFWGFSPYFFETPKYLPKILIQPIIGGRPHLDAHIGTSPCQQILKASIAKGLGLSVNLDMCHKKSVKSLQY